MNITIDHILAGVSAGGQYALIAIGYTMVYGILRLINFAHGDVFMVAGLIMVYASREPAALCLDSAGDCAGTVLLGVLIESASHISPLRIGAAYVGHDFGDRRVLSARRTSPCTSPAVWPAGLSGYSVDLATTVTILGATTKRVTLITPVLTLAAGRCARCC